MILTLYASAGDGHRSVARTLDYALSRQAHNRVLADALSFSSSTFRFAYQKGYEFAAHHMRWLCGFFFAMTDKPRNRSFLVRNMEDQMSVFITGLSSFLRENAVQAVCCTHFLPLTLMGNMRRNGLYQGSIHACVTDYDAHGFWFEPETDRYYVGSEKAAERLHGWGIPHEHLSLTGIPVRPEFYDETAMHGQKQKISRVLVIASSLKTREVVRILREISDTELEVEVSLVAGRNPILLKELAPYQFPSRMRLDKRSFEPHMEMLMNNADVLITKPGGITCTEALCSGLPMFFVSPIPLHEQYNARILESLGAGYRCYDKGSITHFLQEMNAAPDKLRDMSMSCRRAARPNAAEAVSKALMAST